MTKPLTKPAAIPQPKQSANNWSRLLCQFGSALALATVVLLLVLYAINTRSWLFETSHNLTTLHEDLAAFKTRKDDISAMSARIRRLENKFSDFEHRITILETRMADRPQVLKPPVDYTDQSQN